MGLSWVDPKNHVLDGVQIPRGMGNFEGCPALESIASHCCVVRCKKINNGITAPLLQPTAILPTGWRHVTLSICEKSAPDYLTANLYT